MNQADKIAAIKYDILIQLECIKESIKDSEKLEIMQIDTENLTKVLESLKETRNFLIPF